MGKIVAVGSLDTRLKWWSVISEMW